MMYERVIRAAMRTPWAMLPEKLEMVAAVLSERGAGVRWTREEIEGRLELLAPGARESSEPWAALTPSPSPDATGEGNTIVAWNEFRAAVGNGRGGGGGQGKVVAVLPVVGILQHRASEMAASSGVLGINVLARRFGEMVAEPSVDAIVLDVDSPGGGVTGIAEFAAQVREARGSKRVVAVANGMAASAAYWIASAAGELWVTPSGEVGSIGVYAMHVDESQALENEGLVVTAVSAGKFKTEGAPWGPLDDEARAEIQRQVDHYYGMFVSDVAAGRGVSASVVRGADFGQGRMVQAKEAVRRGMADRVGTLEAAVAAAAGGARGEGRGARALRAADAWGAAEAAEEVAVEGVDVEELTKGVSGSVIRDRRRELELLRLRR